jgi:hypothetical protein
MHATTWARHAANDKTTRRVDATEQSLEFLHLFSSTTFQILFIINV